MTDYRIINADVMDGLAQLPDASVHCVITSPPYFGLRHYGIDGQIGLEATPAEFVAVMVRVFEEVRRVLRPDGTLWLNLGDSYASSPAGNKTPSFGPQFSGRDMSGVITSGRMDKVAASGLKPKDLMMMPARVALALQDAGWWLRSDIIWCKRAPMPESVTDRPTSAHEHIFLLTRSDRYYYDADAVRSESVSDHPSGNGSKREYRLSMGGRGQDEQWQPTSTRNLWNYWLLSPEPYAAAHFATFPTEIPRRCILAGTSERGVCAQCGAPWKRVVEKSGGTTGNGWHNHNTDLALGQRVTHPNGHGGHGYKIDHKGWAPTCRCNCPDTVPATVLDPFSGAGTTLLVAQRLGRRSIGIELNPEYVEMAHKRIESDPAAMNMHMDLQEIGA